MKDPEKSCKRAGRQTGDVTPSVRYTKPPPRPGPGGRKSSFVSIGRSREILQARVETAKGVRGTKARALRLQRLPRASRAPRGSSEILAGSESKLRFPDNPKHAFFRNVHTV